MHNDVARLPIGPAPRTCSCVELGTLAMVSMMVRTILAVLALGMTANSGRSSVSRSRSAPALPSFAYRSLSLWIACAQGPAHH